MSRFRDLSSAGRELASELLQCSGSANTVVLGIVTGGAPVALEVAKQLKAPLDLVILRRMLAPNGPHSPVGAINVAGTLVVDDNLPPRSVNPASPLEYFIAAALDELDERVRACRGERPVACVNAKNVVLVDNGIHTGSTVLSAIRAIRTLDPAGIVIAVPILAGETRAAVERASDGLIFLQSSDKFGWQLQVLLYC
jgi:putative phosphoribosyl transferase